MKIAVLGCGPAGLMAAHAAVEEGHEVRVFSHKVLSPMSGAQYLHEAIPGVTNGEPDEILYFKRGDAVGYADKVYGSADAPTSWDTFAEGAHKAWSLPGTYMELVHRYWDLVQEAFIEPHDISELCRDYDRVISSVPLRKLCLKPGLHVFKSQEVCIVPGQPVTIEAEPIFDNNVVIYNGDPTDDWYRTSSLFGSAWTEYSRHRTPHSQLTRPDARRGVKPIETTCDCHESIIRVGRFGQWKKTVLTSDAYRSAKDRLEAVDVVH